MAACFVIISWFIIFFIRPLLCIVFAFQCPAKNFSSFISLMEFHLFRSFPYGLPFFRFARFALFCPLDILLLYCLLLAGFTCLLRVSFVLSWPHENTSSGNFSRLLSLSLTEFHLPRARRSSDLRPLALHFLILSSFSLPLPLYRLHVLYQLLLHPPSQVSLLPPTLRFLLRLSQFQINKDMTHET
ncbi:unnamed protein product [Coffea canephora]|uniref:DH200=94 genomic scaffold, scaffold_285 n=1 Tax=Coffea canephora TaxID=49390 RepID=A0A068VD78_COFCA|nr:unnamed protein product [Coffea canephora]